MKKKSGGKLIWESILIFAAILMLLSARWYRKVYGNVGFNAIIFTLFSGIGGVEKSLVADYIKSGLLRAVAVTAVLLAAVYGSWLLVVRRAARSPEKLRLFGRWVGGAMIAASLVCIVCAAMMVKLPQWLAGLGRGTQIFEEAYVDPDSVKITFPEHKRNLIYIYVESLENSFFSAEQGGSQTECLLPNLYKLAEENTNFSFGDGVGGWPSVPGTTWTTGGITAQSGGVPLLLPTGANGAEKMQKVLPGVVSLWDILSENGYSQTVMMGSKSTFSGQDKLMSQHGVDRICDYLTAIEDGVIPEDYYVFWGMEDAKVYEYARRVLPEMAAGQTPFAFTMVTIDTHFPGGYLCQYCTADHEEQYEDVYLCADRQIADFLDWVEQQPFCEDTTVIICGDHLSMDAEYFTRKGIAPEKRSVYNCILNALPEAVNTKNRVFTPMDMFPTTLAAIGCRIEGERLGLGTNLYSTRPTLAEEMGLEALNRELDNGTMAFARRFLQQPRQGK